MSNLPFLWLSNDHARAIADHTRAEAPREACGLIAGRDGKAQRVIPIANTAADTLHHYHMDETAFVKAFYDFEAAGLSLVGIYHSHPNGEPIPSQTDIAQANYPDIPYLIVGLKHAEPHFAAWRIGYSDVEPVELSIGIQPPAETEAPLSQAQKIAILTSAVLALVLMLVLSISLLPSPHLLSPLGR